MIPKYSFPQSLPFLHLVVPKQTVRMEAEEKDTVDLAKPKFNGVEIVIAFSSLINHSDQILMLKIIPSCIYNLKVLLHSNVI